MISILSLQRSNGKWVATKRFSQRQIEKEKIRYVHSRGNPRLDYVTFAAQVFPSLELPKAPRPWSLVLRPRTFLDLSPQSFFKLYDAQVNGVAVGKSFTFSIKFINININPVNNRGLVTINIYDCEMLKY